MRTFRFISIARAFKQMLALVICASIFQVLRSQTYSTVSLHEDISALNNAILKAHPINLNKAFDNPLPAIIDSLEKVEYEAYDFVDYHYQLRQIIRRIGCYHTTILPPKLPIRYSENPHFPFKLWTEGSQLYLVEALDQTTPLDSTLIGKSIASINDVPVVDMLPALLAFRPSDGHHITNGVWHFNTYSTLLTREFFHAADSFFIEVGSTKIGALPMPRIKSYGFEKGTQDFLDQLQYGAGPVKLHKVIGVANTGYVRIPTFAYSDGERVARQILAESKAQNWQDLIIDVRGNGGGRSNNASLLASHFTAAPFTGSDAIPKYQKGHKLGFSWARVGLWFWEMAHIGRKVKGEDGERRYPFKQEPSATSFQGTVYLLVDGKTGSTASQFASIMQAKANATIVGQETGGGFAATNAGSYAKYKLPGSKIVVRFPLVRACFDLNAVDVHHGVKPDVEIGYTVQDIISKKDKELEAVFQRVTNKLK